MATPVEDLTREQSHKAYVDQYEWETDAALEGRLQVFAEWAVGEEQGPDRSHRRIAKSCSGLWFGIDSPTLRQPALI